MTIGDRIKEARRLAGMSRKALADASGVPYPTLAGLEVGDQKSSTALPALASALGVSALWLSTGKGHKDAVMNDSGEGTVNKRSGQNGPVSQPARLDPAILLEAERWALIFQTAEGVKHGDLARMELTVRVYEQIIEDGGKLSDQHHAEYLQQLSELVNKRGGGDERSDRPRRDRTGNGGNAG